MKKGSKLHKYLNLFKIKIYFLMKIFKKFLNVFLYKDKYTVECLPMTRIKYILFQ